MAESDDRQLRALEMRLGAATYGQIAQRLGYADESGAHRAVQALIDKHRPIDEDELATDLARLHALLTTLWPKARAADYRAVDRVLEIMRQRRDLIGRPIATADPNEEESGVDEFTRRLHERKSGT